MGRLHENILPGEFSPNVPFPQTTWLLLYYNSSLEYGRSWNQTIQKMKGLFITKQFTQNKNDKHESDDNH